MNNKLTGKARTKFQAKRDVWQEVLDSIREIKAGGGKRKRIEATSYSEGIRRTAD
jgi:putative transcriptional regulator